MDTYTATDDLQLMEDAVNDVPGARAALQVRVDQLPADRAAAVTATFNDKLNGK